MQTNQNLTPQPTYRVELKQNDNTISFADDIPKKEFAVKLSLSLHESSNTPHIIHVIHDDIIDCTFERYATTPV